MAYHTLVHRRPLKKIDPPVSATVLPVDSRSLKQNRLFVHPDEKCPLRKTICRSGLAWSNLGAETTCQNSFLP